MSGYLVTKVVALVREPLIGRAFGTSDQLDAYYAAFNIPDLLFTLIAAWYWAPLGGRWLRSSPGAS